METLRQIEQQIEQIRGLRDIVQTMRTLASTYLKRAEGQLEPVRLYHRVVTSALSSVLPRGGVSAGSGRGATGGAAGGAAGAAGPRSRQTAPPALVLFATEQGLCGRFNEVMVDALQQALADLPHARVVVLGQRGRGVVENARIPVYRSYPAVTSPDGIPRAIRRTAEELLALYDRGEVGAIHFLHAVHQSVGRFVERFERILPLDPSALESLDEEEREPVSPGPGAETGPADGRPEAETGAAFSSPARADGSPAVPARRTRPLTYLPQPILRRRLVEEYYFIRFFRAFLETVASENSVRLQSMEAARINIEETLADLESRRRLLRQNEITEELMDVISGAEAVTARRRAAAGGR